MSTNFAPLFKNAVGDFEQFGAEETLTWDFTSGTGNPMELLVGGSTYFTFDRNGAIALESNITWNTDSGGDVGAQYDYRPDVVNAATSVRVGAVAGGTNYGSMLTLNRLTLGHGDVDKYVDAEQGLADTPFMRYNAVNTRWEYSNDGIVVIAFDAGFGVGTWDAIYATDKTLTIDAASLVWSQTATTNVGFAVTRNLTSTSTDTGILLVEQQHASDNQPPLVVAQNAATTSALSIYEGLYGVDGAGGGTERFSFNAAGQLAITTNATLAGAAVSIDQTDDDEAFLLTTGTAAADASKNVSTANSGTADMIRVEVDGGGGAATRWVPAYNNVTLPGTVSWDGVYLLDKTLDINSTVLTFTQSTTTGRGFQVDRNQAVDDAPVMVIEQQHASGSESPLAVGQLNSAADVLQLYDGSITSGTLRFQFEPLGRLNIVGSASLTTEAFRLELNDATTPFIEVKGTAAAGTGNNISTDSTPPVEMLQIAVDTGSGANKRWLPAYVSPTIASTYDWDLIYAADKHLDIDAAVLQFEQTSATGHAFEIFRNLPAGSTDSAIVHIENQDSTDDQPTLLLEGGIGAVAAGMDVLQIQTTSAGMTGGTEVLRSCHAILTTNAGDHATSELHGYYVDSPTPVGSGTTHGFHATANLDYGLYSLAPVALTNDVVLQFGTSGDAQLEWDTGQTQNALLLGLGASRSIIVCETGDMGTDFAHAVSAGPTIFVQSATVTDVGDYVGLSYDGLTCGTMQTDKVPFDFTIKGSTAYQTPTPTNKDGGHLILEGGDKYTGGEDGIVQIGSTFATSHSLVDKDDLGIAGKLEVDGDAWFDAIVYTLSGFYLYSGTQLRGGFQNSSDDGVLFFVDGTDGRSNNNLILTTQNNRAKDHDHETLSTNPTFLVHSVLDPDTDNGEFVQLSYTGLLCGTMETDRATYDFTIKGSNAASGATGTNDDGGHLILEGGDKDGSGVDGVVQIGTGTPTYANAKNDLYVAGQLEVASTARMLGTVVYYSAARAEDNIPIYWGTGSDVRAQYSTAQTAHALVWGLSDSASPDGSRNLIFCDTGDIATNFTHAASTNPTIFLQAADVTDVGDYVGLSYTGLLCGTMQTDKVPFDFTIKGANAYSGGTNDDGGNLILEGGDKDGSGEDGIVQIGSTFTSSHGLVDNDDLGVAGKLEINGNTFFDGSVILGDDVGILLGASGDARIDWDTTQTSHALMVAVGDTSNTLLLCPLANSGSNFDHANASHPTVFVHSALAPTTDTGEFVGLSYTGLQCGEMSSDRATYDFTIKGSTAYQTGTPTNDDGGHLILEGGDKGTGGEDGIVQVGSSFTTSHSLVDLDDLGVEGKLEVNGNAYFDSTFFIASNQQVVLGSASNSSMRFSTVQTNDALAIHVDSTSDTLLITDIANISKDHDHAVASDPTVFVHSVLDPDTDNGEFVGLSYTGLLCGTMSSDRLPSDFTIKAGNAWGSAGVSYDDGADLILEGGDGSGAGTDGVVKVNSSVQFYASATYYGAITYTQPIYIGGGAAGDNALVPSQSFDQWLFALGSNYGRAMVIGDRAYYLNDYDHAVTTNPTVFVHSALDPDTDNGEFVGLSYDGLQCGTMSSDRATYDFTIKGSNAFSTATINEDGGNVILEGGDKDASGGVDGIVQVGSAFTSGRGLVDKDDLGIGGKLEVDNSAFFDAGFTTYANSSIPANVRLYFGSASEASIVYHASQTLDALMIGAPDAGDTSRNVIICEQTDVSTDFGHGQETNPTLWVQSADASTPAQWINFAHDQTDGIVATGAGKLQLQPATTTRAVAPLNTTVLEIAPSANPTAATGLMTITAASGGLNTATLAALQIDLTGNVGGDVTAGYAGTTYVFTAGGGGSTEIAYAMNVSGDWDFGLYTDAPLHLTNDVAILFGNNPDAAIQWDTTQTANALLIGIDGSRTMLMCDYSYLGSDFGHAAQNDPTLFIHSATDPAGDDTEWLGATHNQTDGLLTTGKGKLQLQPATTTRVYSPANTTVLEVAPANPTSALTAQTISITSGGLSADTVVALDVDLASNAGDTGATFITGVSVDYTDNGGTTISYGANFSSGLDYAFYAAAPGQFADDVTLNIGNELDAQFEWDTGQTADALLLGLSGSYNLIMCNKAHMDSDFDHAGESNPTLFIQSVTDPDSANDEWISFQHNITDGVIETGSGKLILNPASSVQLDPGGTTRLTVTTGGLTTIATSSTLASEALQIDQQDADQEFVYFNGTASDPAGGSAPADNITEITGSGAVVGPTTTGGAGETGWAFNGMIKIKTDAVVGGTVDVWIANYTPVTS